LYSDNRHDGEELHCHAQRDLRDDGMDMETGLADGQLTIFAREDTYMRGNSVIRSR